jgi:hypothetical protein
MKFVDLKNIIGSNKVNLCSCYGSIFVRVGVVD